MKRTPVTAAWVKFFDSQKTESLDDYKAEGWKTPRDLAEEIGIPLTTARNMCQRNAESGRLEVKKIKAQSERGVRVVCVYRPKK
jgi:hypothetical protein